MELENLEAGSDLSDVKVLDGNQGSNGKAEKEEEEKMHPGKVTVDGKVYDHNLLLALHKTMWLRFVLVRLSTFPFVKLILL